MVNDKRIIKSDNYLQKSKMLDGKIIIKNQLINGDLEVNLYKFRRDQSIFLTPPLSKGGLKTYHVLRGKLAINGDKAFLTKGDVVILNSKDSHLNIFVVEETELQGYSFNESSYLRVTRDIKSAAEIIDKIQEKDSYTKGHCQRAYDIAENMGKRLGYRDQKLLNLTFAAGYHDVGKIYIDDSILNKPTRLSKEEYEVMKSHVLKSEEIIKSNFNSDIFDIISQHHERIDGSGYPKGLKGDELLEEGKILAVIDSYDAMTTDRVYRKALTKEDAIKELYQLSGTLYEKKYVDCLVHCIKLD